MSTLPNPPVSDYATLQDVVLQLALPADQTIAGNYMLWAMSIPGDTIQTFVDEANTQVTNLVGDITGQNSLNSTIASQLASKIGALRLVQMMTLQWTTSGLKVSLGSLGVDRLPGMMAAMTQVQQQLQEAITRLTQQLIGQVDVVDSTLPRDSWATNYGLEPL